MRKLVITVACAASIACSSCIAPQTSETPPSATGPSSRTAPTQSPSPTSTPAPTWESTIARVRSGVVRLQVAGCDSTWAGSGFLVKDETSDEFVVTAAHVARNASTISVKGDRGIVRADVVYYNTHADTALLRLRQHLEGYRFGVETKRPGLGRDIGVLGYPFAVTDLRLTKGTISGGDISVTYGGEDGFTVDHVVTTDAAINGGNSGGPAIDVTGRVVGLVTGNRNWNGDLEDRVPAQGNNLLVPADVISDRVEAWDQKGDAAPPDCDADNSPPVDPNHDLDVTVEADDAVAADVALALYSHGNSINQGAYGAAWEILTPRLQRRFGDVDTWRRGLETSYWDRIVVTDVTGDDDQATAKVRLRTRQDKEYGHGHDCSDWKMTYSMVKEQGTWRIDDARGASVGC